MCMYVTSTGGTAVPGSSSFELSQLQVATTMLESGMAMPDSNVIFSLLFARSKHMSAHQGAPHGNSHKKH